MNFFAIFFALLLEQVRPVGRDNPVHELATRWARWVRRNLDDGQRQNGWLAWLAAAGGPTLLSLVVYLLLSRFSLLLSFAWLVGVLYLTLGFRQFSHHFTRIRDALEAGDEAGARAEFAAWQRVDVRTLPRQELLRQLIEHSALSAHRHVFGVLLAFTLPALLGFGPAGAVLYRMSEALARRWQPRVEDAPSAAACQAAAQAWRWTDWLPSRTTALAFAIVGNFEEAIAAWRSEAARFAEPNDGVVLAATSGAINVRLGARPPGLQPPELAGIADTAPAAAAPSDAREPQLGHLASLVGLVWRSVVLWLLLLALMTLARSVG